MKFETKDNRYETQKGSGDYLTMRDVYNRSGQDVPDYNPPADFRYLVDVFWELKGFVGDVTDPITPGLLRDYSETIAHLSKWEQGAIFRCDRDFRAAMNAKRESNHKAAMAKKK